MNNNEQNIATVLLCPICKRDIPLISISVRECEVVLHFRCISLGQERELGLKEYELVLNSNSMNRENEMLLFELQLICGEHKEKYEAFCLQCYKSICSKCKSNHDQHHLISIKRVSMSEKKAKDEQLKEFFLYIEEMKKRFHKNDIKEDVISASTAKQKMNLFSIQVLINKQLLFLWKLIANTATLIQEYPNYSFMILMNKLQINKAKQTALNNNTLTNSKYNELNSDLDREEENYLMIDLKATQMKEYSEIQSFDCSHGLTKRIRSIIQLSDSNICSSSDDETIKIWELNTLKCIKTLTGHVATVTCLVQLKDNRLVSGSFDHSIKFWDLNQDECITTFEGEYGSIWCLSQMRNEDLVSGSYYNSIQIWDVNSFQCKAVLICNNSVWELTQLTNELLYACVEKNVIEIWQPLSGQRVTKIVAHNNRIMSITELSNNKQFATCSIDKTIKIWSMISFKCIRTITGHSDGIYSIVQLNSWSLASCSWDKTVKIWEISTSQCISTLKRNDGVTALIKLQDGRLASIERSILSIWNN